MHSVWKLSLALGLALAAAPSAFADDVEGLVRVVGSAVNAKVILTPEKEYTGPALCRDEQSRKVGRLGGMIVKATGEMQQIGKDATKKCLKVQSFTVTKMANGRDAVVGTLSKKDAVFVITTEAGKVYPLTELPDGLKGLDGKRVVVDLKTMESPGAKESASKVVSYAEMP